jgi:hypothetical protein
VAVAAAQQHDVRQDAPWLDAPWYGDAELGAAVARAACPGDIAASVVRLQFPTGLTEKSRRASMIRVGLGCGLLPSRLVSRGQVADFAEQH